MFEEITLGGFIFSIVMFSIVSFFFGYIFGMNSNLIEIVENHSKLLDYDRMKEENEHLQEALNIKKKRRR